MSQQSPPKRPRLSLQIKALSTGPSLRTSRTLAAVVNPTSPTSFNTLSNVYSTAVDRSASIPALAPSEPVTAIKTSIGKHLPTLPRLQVPVSAAMSLTAGNTTTSSLDRRLQTPYVTTQFPETPLTARPMSPAVAMEVNFPSTMTATPPMSAGTNHEEQAGVGVTAQVFCFSPEDIAGSDSKQQQQQQQRHNPKQQHQGTNSIMPETQQIVQTPATAIMLKDVQQVEESGGSTPYPLETSRRSQTAPAATTDAVVGFKSSPTPTKPTEEATAAAAAAATVAATTTTTTTTTTMTTTTMTTTTTTVTTDGSKTPQLPSWSPPQLRESTLRRRTTAPAVLAATGPNSRRPAPYIHPRSLHSILRNSPLPPGSAKSPVSPRRQSQRLLERASRRVMYNSPLTQTITTNTYTASHMELLGEDSSPGSAQDGTSPNIATPSTPDTPETPVTPSTRDGGATPGPMEEMRRRMAGLQTQTPTSSSGSSSSGSNGIRRRRQPRREKRRRWAWTLGQEDEDEDNLSGALLALKAAERKAKEEEEKAKAEAAEAAVAAEAAKALEVSETPKTAAISMQSHLETGEQKVHRKAVTLNTPQKRSADDSTDDTDLSDASTAATSLSSASISASPQPPTKKRKSTPVPYATDDESDGHDTGVDTDMSSTPTDTLNRQLQGEWMSAATASVSSGAVGAMAVLSP